MALHDWSTRDLVRGDLSLLSDLFRRRPIKADFERLQRLMDRGFVTYHNAIFRVTAHGCAALLIRHVTRHPTFKKATDLLRR